MHASHLLTEHIYLGFLLLSISKKSYSGRKKYKKQSTIYVYKENERFFNRRQCPLAGGKKPMDYCFRKGLSYQSLRLM